MSMEIIVEKLDLILSIINKPKKNREKKHLDPNIILQIKKNRDMGHTIKRIADEFKISQYGVRLALKVDIENDDLDLLEDLLED